eukprot:CAMPEP_0194098194 /NCGR_PEP_ID=MMETSP0149-20130528/58254_1 /TAXON_ID=122233 /ORGANISM="Chaetoceros debilis, Strain MM31A-1" /LENGTH=284 /DNA_ID=CAMNT_0038784235 /DNA_START=197 /DNA_END=1051 /DNA_ORIENTATION=-
MAAIGRKDLPKASRFIGHKVGRLVGLLQGARARADQFAQANELNALQNELRSGLRELDAVKGELAVAASSQGLIGRGLGSTIPRSANREATVSKVGTRNNDALGSPAMHNIGSIPPSAAVPSAQSINHSSAAPIISGKDYLEAAKMASEGNLNSNASGSSSSVSPLELAPRSQSVAAVAEEEWEKQGIGFKTRAEMGTGYWQGSSSSPGGGGGKINSNSTPSASPASNGIGGGSSLLSDLLQQNLIWDQHDRAVMEQDQALHRRVDEAKKRAKGERKGGTDGER